MSADVGESSDLGFVHRYLPPAPAASADAPTLLLLHGTGGNEDDLLDLGRALLPSAGLLGPRGQVLERGMPRFFRRLAEGVFDEDDLRRRTHELADFVGAAAEAYGFDARQVIAVGYSNGANIAASLMLLRPGVLRAAILFRAMVPLVSETPLDLSGVAVLLASGRRDPLLPPGDPERLAAMLRAGGAEVTLRWQENAGHELAREEIPAARDWLAARQRR